MADITMCEGHGCTRKLNCYRHNAIANEYRQSYFVNPPVKEDGSCEHYSKDESIPNQNKSDKPSLGAVPISSGQPVLPTTGLGCMDQFDYGSADILHGAPCC